MSRIVLPKPSAKPSVLTGKIVEWDRQKGYGFVQAGLQRVFLHHHDFAVRHKRPAVGDDIHFIMGTDPKGRYCAQEAEHVNDGGRTTLGSMALLLGLLILPAVALQQRGAPVTWAGGYALLISGLAYLAYAVDKRRARAREWRLSEAGLHALELLGGWPGAFVAQRRLRHKCSKTSYQAVFWLIVLLYQLAALDSLLDWQLSRTALNYVLSRGGVPR